MDSSEIDIDLIDKTLLGWQRVIASTSAEAAENVSKYLLEIETWAPNYTIEEMNKAFMAYEVLVEISGKTGQEYFDQRCLCLGILSSSSPVARVSALITLAQNTPETLDEIISIRPRDTETKSAKNNVVSTLMHLFRENVLLEIYGDDSRSNRIMKAISKTKEVTV